MVQGWQAAVFERWRPRLRQSSALSHPMLSSFLARLPQEIRVRQVPWQTPPEDHALSSTLPQTLCHPVAPAKDNGSLSALFRSHWCRAHVGLALPCTPNWPPRACPSGRCLARTTVYPTGPTASGASEQPSKHAAANHGRALQTKVRASCRGAVEYCAGALGAALQPTCITSLVRVLLLFDL